MFPERRAYFCHVQVNDGILLQGGTGKGFKGDRVVKIGKEDPQKREEIQIEGLKESTFALRSHHSAVEIGEKKLALIGGWDGKKRNSDVAVVDLEKKEIVHLKSLTGRSDPVGLSGHTANRINDRGDILVVGREGGVREQRRFGDVFGLSLDLERRTYSYREAPFKLHSRSGHSADLLASSSKVLLFGGRQSDPWQILDVRAEQRSSFLHEGHAELLERVLRSARPCEVKEGLRYHASLNLDGRHVLVHGGENFRARENVSARLLLAKAVKKGIEWYELETSSRPVPRFGHALLAGRNGKLYTVMGFGLTKRVPITEEICF